LSTPPNPTSSAPEPRILRFAVFDLNLQTGELRKKGSKVRIQEQPFQILSVLLQRPGELVSREELVKLLWPDGTFVEYDHGLNTAVNKLRETLGDSANTPRFIETLPRRGYRFIGEVSVDGPVLEGRASWELNDKSISLTDPAQKKIDDDLPAPSRPFVRLLFLLSQLMYLGFYLAALANMDQVQDLLGPVFRNFANVIAVIVPITAMIGIPVRFFLLTAVGFDYKRFREKYDRIFFTVMALDEIWALAPLLMAPKIGFGLALAIVAALLYLPFGQRTLVQMAYRK
jgi:cholera toxin transcriptional activator